MADSSPRAWRVTVIGPICGGQRPGQVLFCSVTSAVSFQPVEQLVAEQILQPGCRARADRVLPCCLRHC